MIQSLFGSRSLTYKLRGGLEETMATHTAVARRLAGAMEASSSVDFGNALDAEARRLAETDIQREMATLADTQIRYEADAKLLQAAYGRLRTALRQHV